MDTYNEILNAHVEHFIDDESQPCVVVSFGSFEHVFDPEDISRLEDMVLGHLAPPRSTSSATYAVWEWATS